MKFLTDPNRLYQTVYDMTDEERGKYILESCLLMMQGINVPWASKQPKERTKEAIGEYSDEFETFWKEYPKKLGKAGAYVIWKRLKVPLQASINALQWQKKSQQWCNEGGKYIPNPETWLSKRRWEDEPPAEAKAEGAAKERYLDINGIWRER